MGEPLVDIWDAWNDDDFSNEYPNFVYNTLYPDSQLVETTSSPFKIIQPSPDTCKETSEDWGEYFWEYSWTTVFDNGTAIADSTYPVI